MIVRAVVMVAVVATALLLDTVVLVGLTFGGVSPSVLTVTAVAYGWSDGPATGAKYGFGAGLAVDLLGEQLLGSTALVLLLVGYGAGTARRFWSGPVLGGAVAAGGVGGGAGELGHLALAGLFDPTAVDVARVVVQVAVGALFGLLLGPLVLPLVERLSGRYAPAHATGGGRTRD